MYAAYGLSQVRPKQVNLSKKKYDQSEINGTS